MLRDRGIGRSRNESGIERGIEGTRKGIEGGMLVWNKIVKEEFTERES